MRIIAKRALREFWERHPDAKQALDAWRKEVENADWDTPAKAKNRYPHASIIPGNRVVFNIRGNRYRLVAEIDYRRRALSIRFIGTHAEYDRIDAREV